MSSVRLRPTFSLKTELKAPAAIQEVRNAISARNDFAQGQFTNRHALISIVESERHFWSPWLNVTATDREQGCEIFGRFSPNPAIWTAFMFTYLSLAVLLFFSVIFGISQHLAGQTTWAYAFIPVLVLIGLALWIASQAGQRLADSEMRQLKNIILVCTDHLPE